MSTSSIFAKPLAPQAMSKEDLTIVTCQLRDMIQKVRAEFATLALKYDLDPITQTWMLHLTCMRKMLDTLVIKLETEIVHMSKEYALPPEKITHAMIEGLQADKKSYFAEILAKMLEEHQSSHHASDESVSQTALRHS